MPRRLFNWTFDDVIRFLKDKNFHLNHIEGSHYYYVASIDNIPRQVCVQFHGRKAIKPRTMKSIILQSGIDMKEWLK